MRSSPKCLNLCVALLLSFLAHAALLLPLPYPGTAHRDIQGTDRPPTTLVARLAPLQPASPPEASTPSALPTPRHEPPPGAISDAPEIDRGHFYSAHQLSRQPRPIDAVNLDIPEAALLTQSGTVILTLRIDARGQVVAYEIDAPGLPEEFATALAETFSAARFAPGEIAGHKVSSILKVEVTFGAADDSQR